MDLSQKPRSIVQVNMMFAAHGIPERLARAKDYFYFYGGAASSWNESGVYVFRVSDLTFDQWLSEYEHKSGNTISRQNLNPNN